MSSLADAGVPAAPGPSGSAAGPHAGVPPRGPVRVTPNLFGIPFGLAGLAGTWQVAHTGGLVAQWPAVALFALTALVWLVLAVAWALQFRRGHRSLAEELRDPVFSPFVSLLPIVGVLLAVAVAGFRPGTGRVLVDVLVAATVLLGGWLTAGWILDRLGVDSWHPGYFLPTVAGGLVGAGALAAVGQPGPATAVLGIGLICWLTLGSIILARLFLRPPLPAALTPTLAIELAPPVVAGNAYFALNGDRPDVVAYLLAGYAVLMVLVQLRLITVYRRLSFSPGFWAFTFSYAAAATLALRWLALTRPAGATALAVLVLIVITGFVAAIAGRTAVGLFRGTFLPRPPAVVAAPTES